MNEDLQGWQTGDWVRVKPIKGTRGLGHPEAKPGSLWQIVYMQPSIGAVLWNAETGACFKTQVTHRLEVIRRDGYSLPNDPRRSSAVARLLG
jgi:hypothetical protein